MKSCGLSAYAFPVLTIPLIEEKNLVLVKNQPTNLEMVLMVIWVARMVFLMFRMVRMILPRARMSAIHL